MIRVRLSVLNALGAFHVPGRVAEMRPSTRTGVESGQKVRHAHLPGGRLPLRVAESPATEVGGAQPRAHAGAAGALRGGVEGNEPAFGVHLLAPVRPALLRVVQ